VGAGQSWARRRGFATLLWTLKHVCLFCHPNHHRPPDDQWWFCYHHWATQQYRAVAASFPRPVSDLLAQMKSWHACRLSCGDFRRTSQGLCLRDNAGHLEWSEMYSHCRLAFPLRSKSNAMTISPAAVSRSMNMAMIGCRVSQYEHYDVRP